MAKEKPLSLPLIGDRMDYGYQAHCGCGSTDVTFVKAPYGGVGMRCWYCERYTQLIDKTTYLRNLDGCGINNYKRVSDGDVKDSWELRELFKKE